MFPQQNGLVDPMEMPFFIGLSWVMKIKADIVFIKRNSLKNKKSFELTFLLCRWNKRNCGIVCFVKDNSRRSYYIRIFDMDRRMVIFDQEIYNQVGG